MTTRRLEWTEKHRIGVDYLDYEHQKLFKTINLLTDELDRHVDKEEINACLGEIHARMTAHFALEEQYMREKRYGDYAAHKAEHDKFLDDFVDVMVRFENAPGDSESALLRGELMHWIDGHVLTSDKRLGAGAR